MSVVLVVKPTWYLLHYQILLQFTDKLSGVFFQLSVIKLFINPALHNPAFVC